MRYKIDHVLNGIALLREDELKDLAGRIDSLISEHAETSARSGELGDQVRSTIREALKDVMKEDGPLFAEDLRTLEDSLWRIRGKAPSRSTLERLERQVANAQAQTERLQHEAEEKDSDLERFLHLLQEAGETTVSQYAVTEAGFKRHKLSAYVIRHGQHEHEKKGS
jgi:hypothetical protein